MKILRVIFLIVFLLVVAYTTIYVWKSPEPFAGSSVSAERLSAKKFNVLSFPLTIVDENRPTPALGKFSGSKQRILKGTVWYPDQPKMTSVHPLLVFSHGFSSFHTSSLYLIEDLVTRGYIVAAVDFPLSNIDSLAGEPQVLDVTNQAGDVSAVIDHLLALNADEGSKIFNQINPAKIGAMGLSLGGLTTALSAFHPDLLDTRISAAAMFAAPLEAVSEQFFDTRPHLPSLFISGTKDRVVPPEFHDAPVRAMHPRGWFLELRGASHVGFAGAGNAMRVLDNPDDLVCLFLPKMLISAERPKKWHDVLPEANGAIRNIEIRQACTSQQGPDMSPLRQQWLTRLAVSSFFDWHLGGGKNQSDGKRYFTEILSSENPDAVLRTPVVGHQ